MTHETLGANPFNHLRGAALVLQQHPVILGLSAAAVVADLGAGLVTPPPP